MKHIAIRIAADIALVLGLFLFPWWLWAFCALVSVAAINRHYELVIWGIVADAVYAGDSSFILGRFFFLGLSTLLVLLSIVLKPRLKFYTNE